MADPVNIVRPLVSVIIPCYNHGVYLTKAIESIKSQSYPISEIIIVDDGSADNTREISAGFPDVKYVYQKNAGLSAARNTGIKHAKGEYLVFLDADDWLLNNALEINAGFLNSDTNAAFVAGGYELYYEPEDRTWLIQQEITGDYYCGLLKGNFIGMHATVMYRSWVFDQFEYNTSLRYCEDYDLYLRITRLFPIIYHTQLIAVYRKHHSNMSADSSGMLKNVLLALSFQKKYLKTPVERESYKTGVAYWKSYYSQKIYEDFIGKLYAGIVDFDRNEIRILKENNRSLYLQFANQPFEYYTGKKKNIKKIFFSLLKKMYVRTFRKPATPGPGKIRLGDFNRTNPFSERFGYDRGGPIDRYYIENFLSEYSSKVRGRVLEIGDNEYTFKYGGDKIVKSDILHIDDSNDKATFIGDLSDVPLLPSDSFDCIILTQTLHLIYDFKGAIRTCYRVLNAGGVLLITVPGISHIAQDGWGKFWLWSFTNSSMQRMLEEYFPAGNISVKTHGNVLAASAFLYGMGLPELTKEQIDLHDEHYQVIITVCATK